MTRTVEAGAIQLGDQMRSDFNGPFSTVIEREAFRRGTRIWVRLENGTEQILSAATNTVINRDSAAATG
jgi:hypothetical protein